MAKKRKPNSAGTPRERPPRAGRSRRQTKPGAIGARRLDKAGTYELVHPRGARDRALDLEEVQAMIEAGELEIAIDELRWLLGGCHELLAGHVLLGEIALLEGLVKLARGHFGYAYELGRAALAGCGRDVRLPYARSPNRPLLEAAKGLAGCLAELRHARLGREVARQLLAWDASDPLGAAALLERLATIEEGPPDEPDEE